MPRNPEQNERARAQRREAILRAARRRFAAQGFGATRVGDIARDAGMAQGLLYHYYPGKEALFEALLEDAFAKLGAAVRGLEASAGSPADKLAAAMAGLVEAIAGSDAFAPTILLIAQAGLSEATSDRVRALMGRERDRPYAAIARIIAAGQRDGGVLPGDPDALAVAFWAIVKGLALHKVGWGEAFRAPAVDVLLRPFLASPATGEPPGDPDER